MIGSFQFLRFFFLLTLTFHHHVDIVFYSFLFFCKYSQTTPKLSVACLCSTLSSHSHLVCQYTLDFPSSLIWPFPRSYRLFVAFVLFFFLLLVSSKDLQRLHCLLLLPPPPSSSTFKQRRCSWSLLGVS